MERKKEIIVNDSFQNRLGKLVSNFSTLVDDTKLQGLMDVHSEILRINGYTTFDKYNLEDLLDAYNHYHKIDSELNRYVYELLVHAREVTLKASIFKREMAMEEFRKNNNPNLPSRMHCLYELNEKSIEYWINSLRDGDLELFRIEAVEEPFKTCEQLIPYETLNYKDFYDASYSYWNPSPNQLRDDRCEYLIKGKVKILEKVNEYKINKY